MYLFCFIIYFVLLQQVDNNLIYPNVVGNKVGLPSIWVLVAVIIGGGLGGVVGMLLGIPILSMLYSYLMPAKQNGDISWTVQKLKIF